MPTGEIALWKGTGCLGAGAYPAVRLYGEIGSPVQTFTGKFTEDLDQAVTVPYFSGWSDCNLCTLTPTGGTRTWYWITDVSRSTDLNGSVTLALSYCPTMDITDVDGMGVSKTAKALGDWSRWSNISDSNVGERYSCADGPEVRQNLLVNIPTLGDTLSATAHQLAWVCWVQITYADVQKGLTVCGFFAWCGYGSGYKLYPANAPSAVQLYPTLTEIVTDSYDTVGITASTIQDISISPYCPYEVGTVDFIDPYGFICLKSGGADVYPSLFKTRMMYKLMVGSEIYAADPVTRTVSCTLSNVQKRCSSLYVINQYGNSIGQLNFNDYKGSSSLTLKYTVESDLNGMTLRIEHNSTTIREALPHIPYVGNQWDEYRAYSMSLDRQAMNFAISQSHESLKIQKDTSTMSTILGVGTSLLSGNISGAVNQVAGTLIGMQAQDRQQQLSDKAARFSQQMAESRAQSNPPSAYNTGYGMLGVYLFTIFTQRHRLEAWAPSNTGAVQYVNYNSSFGVPCKMINTTATLSADGFYQGRLYELAGDARAINGAKRDRLASLMLSGLKTVIWQNRG